MSEKNIKVCKRLQWEIWNRKRSEKWNGRRRALPNPHTTMEKEIDPNLCKSCYGKWKYSVYEWGEGGYTDFWPLQYIKTKDSGVYEYTCKTCNGSGKNIFRCPSCWESDYDVLSCSKTLVYYKPRIVDGVNMNPDRNKETIRCECNKCWNIFTLWS